MLSFICLTTFDGLSLAQVVSGGTCAIVHRNHLGIFVGIDSKVTNIGDLPPSGPECKIGIRNGVIFFGEGSVRAKPIYDGYDIASSEISYRLPLKDIVTSFINRVQGLSGPLSQARNANPQFFDSSFVDSKLFDFTFIKHEQDSIYFALCEFKYDISPSSDLVIYRRITFGADVPNPTMLYGEVDAIKQAMRDAKTNTLGKARTAFEVGIEIERLINLQSTQTPVHVGGPIQIIWMRADGQISWLKNSLPCNPIIDQ